MGTTNSKNGALSNPAATPEASSWRRLLRLCHKASPPPPGTTRDWANLPRDVLWSIFSRLPHADILRGAGLVCASWRRCFVDEPTLWRHIEVPCSKRDGDYGGLTAARLAMARAAVDRSAGRCESFRGPADSEFLAYLADSAPSLRVLHVTSRATELKEFTDRAVTFPRLERLKLSRGFFPVPLGLAFVDHCPRLEVLVAGCVYFKFKDCDSSVIVARLTRTINMINLNRNNEFNSGTSSSSPSADILRDTGLVCASWRRCSVDEPTLWRHIDIASNRDGDYRDDKAAAARQSTVAPACASPFAAPSTATSWRT